MTDADLYRLWYLWLAIGGAIVLVAAALLGTIWLTARGIQREALRALRAVEKIEVATRPIWLLDETNQVASDILAAARDLETHGAEVAVRLCGSAPVNNDRT
jgi:hypothetical protein